MKWYQNNFKLFFAILLIAPLGIFGLFKRQTSKNNFKIISLVLSVIYGVFYGIFLILASLKIGKTLSERVFLPAILFTMHMSWGIGFIT